MLKRLGKRVRALRLQRKLTQQDTAGAAKLDKHHWQAIEGAQTNPTVATLVGVARALDVTLPELFADDGDRASEAPAPALPPAPPGRRRRGPRRRD